jgi:hypothetical protein
MSTGFDLGIWWELKLRLEIEFMIWGGLKLAKLATKDEMRVVARFVVTCDNVSGMG